MCVCAASARTPVRPAFCCLPRPVRAAIVCTPAKGPGRCAAQPTYQYTSFGPWLVHSWAHPQVAAHPTWTATCVPPHSLCCTFAVTLLNPEQAAVGPDEGHATALAAHTLVTLILAHRRALLPSHFKRLVRETPRAHAHRLELAAVRTGGHAQPPCTESPLQTSSCNSCMTACAHHLTSTCN